METTWNNNKQQDIPGGIGESRRGRDGQLGTISWRYGMENDHPGTAVVEDTRIQYKKRGKILGLYRIVGQLWGYFAVGYGKRRKKEWMEEQF